MKVLLSEGSGLTSRQTAGHLHGLGHTVGVLSSDPRGLTRFTKAARHWHRVPAFGKDPFAWLDAAVKVARRNSYDVLFPTQEQVTVLAWASDNAKLGGVKTLVPPFESLRAVQDKIAAHATLERLDIPQPASTVLYELDDLRNWDEFPVFMKTPIAGDSLAAVPLAAATALALVSPSTWKWFASESVANYAVSPEGWRAICTRDRS